ncbi:flagellar assembly factor FliW [Alkalithermobacter thermoalcaliphilus JW-YL-7 = DSM 7308]|uniref:Flagellar assembly factor FliW n=1 Tax=Alkalithermobacter thermoalcaliphilus JW-YL-7 = DSM 7308 TaxID=1121328 RepID=A0A150FN50_CLOPD|nr:Flagellar assembly factor fliW [[Clostridium] paradoxum JW-YL-7 = DSM 7308]SHL05920.1 flagellar assembly factor FliW [[Clostridium] paradoxum JW-YL-7 = DSM 7308]
MKIKTMNFGEIEVKNEDIITFEEGIPGFENLTEFVIIKDEDMVFSFLQSIQEDVTLILINPFLVNKEYEFEINETTMKKLNINSHEDLSIYTVVTIPEDIKQMRTNLQAPIIINNKERKGRQIILDENYPLRYNIFKKVGA